MSASADVVSNRMLCGSARIEGRFRGKIVCTGEACVQISGAYEGDIDAGTLMVHKKADVTFTNPVYGRAVEINGKARGIVVCDGKVVITKKGLLEGTIYARSIVVEKGGIFSGNLVIGEAPPAELLKEDERTWFPGGPGASEVTPTIVGEDFGDLPPIVGGSGGAAGGYGEEPLHQPQVELHLRRPRRKGR